MPLWPLMLLLTFGLVVDVIASAEPAPADAAIAMAIDQAAEASDAKALAWAAWSAEGHPTPVIAQALTRSLRARATLADAVERRCAVDVVLDQLIRGRVQLTSEFFEDLIDDNDCQAQAIILAAADPQVGAPALRHMVGQFRGFPSWLAACNVLASTKDRSLALPLLRQLTLHQTLMVTTPGRGGGSASGRSITACGSLNVPATFPPDPLYELTLTSRAGDLYVASGPRLVTAIRTEYPAGKHGSGSNRISVDRDALTNASLALLKDSHVSVPPLKTPEGVRIDWTNAGALLAEASVARTRTEQHWSQVVDALVLSGMLDSEERLTLAPAIVVKVLDFREDQHEALPTVRGQVTTESGGGARNNPVSP